MKSIGVTEARARFSELLEEAARGETVAITKRGMTVAWLVPSPSLRKADPLLVIEELRQLRRGLSLEGDSLREMIAEGRRA